MILQDCKKTIESIYLNDNTCIELGLSISKIIVVEENGQMGLVPWFEVYDGEGRLESKHNGALIQSVYYKED